MATGVGGSGGLAGRPGHFAPAQEVEMEVVDSLPPVDSGVGHEAVAAGIEAELRGHFRREREQAAEQRRPRLALCIPDRGEVIGWNKEDVRGSDRLNVAE